MINILRGPQTALSAYCARNYDHLDNIIGCATPPDLYRSWYGLRSLLAQLNVIIGPTGADAILAPRRAATSLLFHGLTQRLTPAELAERELLRASLTSHLSHNGLIKRPLVEACATLLRELTVRAGSTILVPNVARLDWESAQTLKHMYRLFPDSSPGIILGYDPHTPPPVPDEQGLVWPLDVGRMLHVVFGLQAAADTDMNDVSRTNLVDEQAPQPCDAAHSSMTLPIDIEARAFEILQTNTIALNAQESALLFQAVQNSFHSFGFTSAIRLGLGLVNRQSACTSEQLAEVHQIIGLSAHNRQFHTDGNMALAAFLERHFRAALAVERRPAERSALFYRLAVTLGRRQGKLDEALNFADRAVSEAASSGLSEIQAAHLAAWGRNIRAYLHMRLKNPQQSAVDAQVAFEQIEAARSGLESRERFEREFWSREMVLTHAVLAHNLGTLADRSGALDRAMKWLSEATHIEEAEFTMADMFEAGQWISVHRQQSRLDLALPWALSGLKAAHAEQDSYWEYLYIFQAGDLYYRLGQPGQALYYFEQARVFRQRLGNPDFLKSADLSCALACARLERLDLARDILTMARMTETHATVDAQAQIISALACIEARLAREAAARSLINQAIQLAVSSGERDTLARVALAAGSTSQALGQWTQAKTAYQKALNLAQSHDDGTHVPALATEMFVALIGLQECSAPDPELTLKTLRLLKEALKDADAWWELGRLLRLLTGILDQHPTFYEKAADLLDELFNVASQRDDCAQLVARLREKPGAAREALIM
jgi:tetratricopeptide (TPR) repeat protein